MYARTSQSVCEPGFYCSGGLSIPCPEGTYGVTFGLSSSNCTAPCPPGYYCPEQSVTPTICPEGTFGGVTGLTSPSCEGLCAKGHYCPDGSTTPTQLQCPEGRYGAEAGLTNHACSQDCSSGYCVPTVCEQGHYCPSGSSSGREHVCGGDHLFCPRGSHAPTPVAEGHYTVGGGSDGTTRDAQVECERGHYCVGGRKYECPPGTYGGADGLAAPACSGLCEQGHYCPSASVSGRAQLCGGATVYCPVGSATPLPVQEGYFTAGGEVASRSTQEICPPGWWCRGGVKRRCAAGVYGAAEGMSSPACGAPCPFGSYCAINSTQPVLCPGGRYGRGRMTNEDCDGICEAGFYCPPGSYSPTQNECGGEDVYCPPGSAAPVPVSSGHYSTGGTVTTRFAQQPCRPTNALPKPGSYDDACPEYYDPVVVEIRN